MMLRGCEPIRPTGDLVFWIFFCFFFGVDVCIALLVICVFVSFVLCSWDGDFSVCSGFICTTMALLV